MELIRDITRNYYVIFHERDDPRTRAWFLMGSPTEPLAIIVLYLSFILYFGPRFMTNKKPYNLSKIMMAINVVQVFINVWIIKEFIQTNFFNNFNCVCATVDYSDNPIAIKVSRICWLYTIVKVIDLADTVLMVLRKKHKQVSFLHVFHHVSTLFISWMVVKYAAGGMAVFPETLNCAVHVLMYTYYLLAALGPSVQPYLWWKKYLTTIQIVQLTIMGFVGLTSVVTGCNYSIVVSFASLLTALVDIIMFCNFYRVAYGGKLKSS